MSGGCSAGRYNASAGFLPEEASQRHLKSPTMTPLSHPQRQAPGCLPFRRRNKTSDLCIHEPSLPSDGGSER